MKVTLLLVIFVVGAYSDQRLPINFPDYYSCDGKADGSYTHPNDCTRFILCGVGKARDDHCMWCDKASYPEQCGDKDFLVFDERSHTCRFPSDVPCAPTGPQPPPQQQGGGGGWGSGRPMGRSFGKPGGGGGSGTGPKLVDDAPPPGEVYVPKFPEIHLKSIPPPPGNPPASKGRSMGGAAALSNPPKVVDDAPPPGELYVPKFPQLNLKPIPPPAGSPSKISGRGFGRGMSSASAGPKGPKVVDEAPPTGEIYVPKFPEIHLKSVPPPPGNPPSKPQGRSMGGGSDHQPAVVAKPPKVVDEAPPAGEIYVPKFPSLNLKAVPPPSEGSSKPSGRGFTRAKAKGRGMSNDAGGGGDATGPKVVDEAPPPGEIYVPKFPKINLKSVPPPPGNPPRPQGRSMGGPGAGGPPQAPKVVDAAPPAGEIYVPKFPEIHLKSVPPPPGSPNKPAGRGFGRTMSSESSATGPKVVDEAPPPGEVYVPKFPKINLKSVPPPPGNPPRPQGRSMGGPAGGPPKAPKVVDEAPPTGEIYVPKFPEIHLKSVPPPPGKP